MLDQEVSNQTYGRLIIEPFERGFGITVGNSLRRILLSSLEGSAITSIKIAGASHEFTSLPGVVEDVSDIVLNVKSLVVRMDSDGPKVVTLKANKAGVVTAAEIEADSDITIINPDRLIATLSNDIEFSLEMTVEKGRGYVPGTYDNDKVAEVEVGVLPIDAVFSPVTRVRYKTEETRVGQKINYDRLIMEIWTDGTIGPEMALVESAKILRKHLGPFVHYFDLGEDLAQQEELEQLETVESDIGEEMQEKLDMPTAELQLSARASNCLESSQIQTIGELVSLTESELLSLRSFGKTSLREIRRKLADMGLSLGMNLEEAEE